MVALPMAREYRAAREDKRQVGSRRERGVTGVGGHGKPSLIVLVECSSRRCTLGCCAVQAAQTRDHILTESVATSNHPIRVPYSNDLPSLRRLLKAFRKYAFHRTRTGRRGSSANQVVQRHETAGADAGRAGGQGHQAPDAHSGKTCICARM